MKELARGAPRDETFRVYFVGGGTAVWLGWRESSIDVDLYADRDAVFRNIQEIKERLNVNVEFARPEHFVPPLKGSARRHVLVRTVKPITFYHYDPYAQVLSKVVRGFRRDLDDARRRSCAAGWWSRRSSGSSSRPSRTRPTRGIPA